RQVRQPSQTRKARSYLHEAGIRSCLQLFAICPYREARALQSSCPPLPHECTIVEKRPHSESLAHTREELIGLSAFPNNLQTLTTDQILRANLQLVPEQSDDPKLRLRFHRYL